MRVKSRQPMRYFVTGTDTGVGKTHFSCLLLKSLAAAGQRAAGFKPVSCGGREDALALLGAGDPRLLLDQVNPCHFQSAASPYAAARLENREVDLAAILEAFAFLRDRYENIIVEGIGGWEVPLTRNRALADLAGDFGLPVIVVVANRLGALNHTILTVRNIRERGLTCAGIVLNQLAQERDAASFANRSVLEDLLEVPILHEMQHGATGLDIRRFGTHPAQEANPAPPP